MKPFVVVAFGNGMYKYECQNDSDVMRLYHNYTSPVNTLKPIDVMAVFSDGSTTSFVVQPVQNYVEAAAAAAYATYAEAAAKAVQLDEDARNEYELSVHENNSTLELS